MDHSASSKTGRESNELKRVRIAKPAGIKRGGRTHQDQVTSVTPAAQRTAGNNFAVATRSPNTRCRSPLEQKRLPPRILRVRQNAPRMFREADAAKRIQAVCKTHVYANIMFDLAREKEFRDLCDLRNTTERAKRHLDKEKEFLALCNVRDPQERLLRVWYVDPEEPSTSPDVPSPQGRLNASQSDGAATAVGLQAVLQEALRYSPTWLPPASLGKAAMTTKYSRSEPSIFSGLEFAVNGHTRTPTRATLAQAPSEDFTALVGWAETLQDPLEDPTTPPIEGLETTETGLNRLDRILARSAQCCETNHVHPNKTMSTF